MKLTVYDPPMCCPTGVCGPAVDPPLVQFAADLEWLAGHGIEIARFNLAQQPAAFAENATVRRALTESGNASLPLIMVDGSILHKGGYPTREQLTGWAHITTEDTPSIFTDELAELVALGAAIASNCEPCFRYHYDQARKLGVSREDMALAVSVAQKVKETPAQSILDLANRYLKSRPAGAPATLPLAEAKSSGKCC
jgi:AhpD family alkylhydroperoxidase